jgi:hypothetical protein
MQNQQSSQVRDTLKLESTLYTLTKKCVKTCKKFLNQQFEIEEAMLYDTLSNNKEINHHFNVCLDKCTHDYAALHQLIRMKFMKDLDDVYQHNQATFDDFYR